MQPCSWRGTSAFWSFQSAYWVTASLALVLSAPSRAAGGVTLPALLAFVSGAIVATGLLARLLEGLRALRLSWTSSGVLLALVGVALGMLAHRLLGRSVFADSLSAVDLRILLLAWAVLYTGLCAHLQRSSRSAQTSRSVVVEAPGRRASPPGHALQGAGGKLVALDGIDYVRAAPGGLYATIGARHERVRGSIRGLERTLDPARFVRVRGGVIVNLARVVALEPAPGGEYELRFASGGAIRSARSYRQLLDRLARREGSLAA